jgi:hypothetical protein
MAKSTLLEFSAWIHQIWPFRYRGKLLVIYVTIFKNTTRQLYG